MVKVSTAKPDDLDSIQGTLGGRREPTPASWPLPPPHKHPVEGALPYTLINIIKIVKQTSKQMADRGPSKIA